MLEFSHVSFAFGAQEVLSDVSFTIPEGGALAVTGPSGCGKTTLLRLAAGLLEPGSGQIRRPAGGAAVVFQEPRLLPWLTAEENVNLVLSDRRETLPRAREWLAALGLGGDAEKYPRELSGGMQRRVAIARALAMRRPLLILDEPFSGLDGGLKAETVRLIAAQGSAVLLATHDGGDLAAFGCASLRLEAKLRLDA